MKKLTRIGPWSLAKTKAVIMAIVGLIVGIIYLVIWGIAGVVEITQGNLNAGLITIGVGIVWLIATPIGAAIAGIICGFIVAWLYNFVAKRFGGIELEL